MSNANPEPRAVVVQMHSRYKTVSVRREPSESDRGTTPPGTASTNQPHTQQQPPEHRQSIQTTQDGPARDEAAADIPTRQAQHGRLSKLVALLYDTWSYLKTRCEQIRWVATSLSLVFGFIGLFALWPSVTAARDGTRAVELAEWDARKSYREYCEAHAWSSPECKDIQGEELGPPPDFRTWTRSIWGHYDAEYSNLRNYGPELRDQEQRSASLLLTFYPTFAFVLLLLGRRSIMRALPRLGLLRLGPMFTKRRATLRSPPETAPPLDSISIEDSFEHLLPTLMHQRSSERRQESSQSSAGPGRVSTTNRQTSRDLPPRIESGTLSTGYHRGYHTNRSSYAHRSNVTVWAGEGLKNGTWNEPHPAYTNASSIRRRRDRK